MTQSPSEYVECPHAAECAGCPGIELPISEQLARKQQRVKGALDRYGVLHGISIGPIVPAAHVVGYRTRAKLVVSAGRLGLFAHASHEVVDIPGCRVLSPEVARVAQQLRSLSPLPDWLSAADLRAAGQGVLAGLVVVEGTPAAAVQELAARVARLPGVLGVSASFRSARSPLVLGRRLRVLCGPAAVREPGPPGAPYSYASHGAFVQAHTDQAEALRAAVIRALGGPDTFPGTHVLELYAGTGALALRLAALGARVTAVEAFAPAAELARTAASEQSLDVEVLAEDACRATREFAGAGRRFDAVLVNPPRSGLSADVRRNIAALHPASLVYVSCGPATLARDLAHLAVLGLGTRAVTPFDMIPLSEHVEALVQLAPSPIPLPTVLYSDDLLIAVDKTGHEPTTPQGEHARSLLDRVRLLPGAEESVPIHRLDAETSGVCLFARRPEHAPELGRRLGEGRKEYVALVRGIARPKGSVARPLPVGGVLREARTRYRRTEVAAGHALLAVSPDHGRKHQIRRHLAGIGHPVLGDVRYGDPASNRHIELSHGLDRMFLHCAKIEVLHAERALRIESPLAADLAAVLDSLRATAPEAASTRSAR